MALSSLVKKIFGSRNQRLLKKFDRKVEQINQLESEWQQLSDQALQEKTNAFKARLQAGETTEDILVEAFATVREAARRTLNMRHFDVQLIGGMCLDSGKIAEMHTGEGKTLVATLAAYLNALTGKGVHVITVNDYLAKRDANWMSPVYEFLQLSVGVVVANMDKTDRQQAYTADITYGTNNEFGFDYLRDNMAFSIQEKVQRELNFAVIDEVDSILIDEARTPLIISGPAEDSSEMYRKLDQLIPGLQAQAEEDGPGDYSVDEKAKQVFLTDSGHEQIESKLMDMGVLDAGQSLYDAENISLMHHVNAALRAHTLFQRDVDYIVRNDEVIIVDEHTGRTMPGRRWSEGLHQAVEAKERVTINQENQTLASITFQNYFRLYEKLSGMTGTADTEAYEFQQIYALEVVVIPTNKPNMRDDQEDLVFLSAREKFEAIIKDIQACVSRQQPVLVGTASIETSEYLSNLMDKANIQHKVLNAKFHQQEAQIIADAGRPGGVTIATNMAGRGTDIVLGGNLKSELSALESATEQDVAALKNAWQERHDIVVAAGGLHVVGSERHESRRIDNQLRGRSGRQGDPGSTRFYLSLDDNLMRIFASPGMINFMRKLHTEDGEPLQSKMLTNGIATAQRKVEGRNFDIRKQLLEFDDVANEQRKVIYQQRNQLMASEDLSDNIFDMQDTVLQGAIDQYIPPNSVSEQWDIPSLEQRLVQDFGLDVPIEKWLDDDDELHEEPLREKILDALRASFQAKTDELGADMMRNFEKAVMLQLLDQHWKEHLSAMDHLRQSVGLRGYAQKDPKQEYKREAFNLFTSMLSNLKLAIISTLARVQVRSDEEIQALESQRQAQAADDFQYQHASISVLEPEEETSNESDVSELEQQKPVVRSQPKLGRNEPCYCGSGKKFKHCHGRAI